MKAKPFSNARGYSIIQLVITIAVASIIAGFAIVGISRARDHVRLMNSARQFAGYLERARGDAVRRHANPGTTVSVVDNNTYSVTMDWDGFGNATTRNFDLDQWVVFTEGMVGKTVTFDWRGRIFQEDSFGFFTRKSFGTSDTDGYSVDVGVTASGDVTFQAQFFQDSSLPAVAFNNTNPRGVMPEPGATPQSSPSSSPGSSPSPSPGQSPGASPSPTYNPSPGASPGVSPSPGASPGFSPSPGVSPSPNPSPVVCSLSANPSALNMASNSSTNVSVNRNNVTGTGTITATSSNSGQIQVTPPSKSVTDTAAVVFKVAVKRSSGSVTFASTGCTSVTVNVTVR